MNDVIERMAKATDVLPEDIEEALRAVSDTHKLVPLEPTKKMKRAILYSGGGAHESYVEAIQAAPDITKPEGQEVEDE